MPTLALSQAREIVWFGPLSSEKRKEKLMVVADEGIAAWEAMSKARAPYCLPAAEPILGPKWWLGDGVGLTPQLHCPPSVVAFQ